MKSVMSAAFFLLGSTAAQAVTLTFGPVSEAGNGITSTFSGLSVPTATQGDATFSFSVRDDLNWSREHVDISIDGYSLGRVFDNNSSNDIFDVAGDVGAQYQMTTASATIDQGIFANLISDGVLEIVFEFSAQVTDLDWYYENLPGYGARSLSGSISFDEASLAPVPLPASVGMLGLGLMVLGGGALRNRRKQRDGQMA